MSAQRFRVNAPSVVAEEVEGEVIAINLATGAYYSMQGWSAWAWSALAAGVPVDDVAAKVPEANVVAGFLTDLLDERLLAPVGDDTVAPDSEASIPSPPVDAFEGLLVERHTDMADLILLDPVHDVDPDKGWPRIADDTQ